MKISKEMTVNDCIKEHPKTIGIFTEFKIDSCCGGAVSIEESAARDHAPLAELLSRLEEAAGE